MHDLSIIIVNYNTTQLTLDCLESIFSQKWRISLEVVLVDNGSREKITPLVKEKYPKVHCIENSENLGFTGGNNIGLNAASKSRYYLLLNSDTKVLEGSLDNFINFADEHSADLAGTYLVTAEGDFQANGGDIPTGMAIFNWLSGVDDIAYKLGYSVPSFHQQHRNYYQNGQQVGWIQGSALLISQKVLETIGLLDSGIFMYCEDVEYCWRAGEHGFKTLWTDKAKILHYGGASSKDPRYAQWLGEFKSLVYLYQKNYGTLAVILLRIVYSFFITLRIVAFALLGKFHYAKTYAKILSQV